MKLINFSGGVDSTLMLLEELNTSPNDVIIQKVVLKNANGRWKPELEAARAIIEKMKEKYKITDNMNNSGATYREIILDVQELETTYDTLYITQLSAAAVSANPNITEVYLGLCKDDKISDYYQKVLDAPFTKRQAEIKTPLIHLDKAQIVNKLNQTGFTELCFWCRTPINSKPCGKCPACVLYSNSI